MYPISAEVISLLKRNYRQIVSITGTIDGQTVELTESNIAQGGLSINRYCLSGSKIEIGSAIAGELTLKLDNRDDRYANTHFEGVELEVKIGIKKWDAYRWENAQLHWIPCGFFTVDETPRKLSYITLTALDRMVRFDKEVDPVDISFPTTIANLLTTCCANCGVSLKTLPSSLTNANYVVSSFPETDELTYRRLIQWIAEISGTCAYIDYDGKLVLAWYSSSNDIPITPSDRYSSDMYEQDIAITGVQISDNDDNIYLAGTDDYAFNIENNDLIQHDYADVAAAIYQKVKNFTYRPYTCSCKPLPYAYPLDGVVYTDKNGIEHKSIVTGITFKMNASTQLEGKGETNIRNGYASVNPLTKGEAIVVKKLENRVNRKINGVEQASLDMNELMSNSLGLYRTSITENNGGITHYYHDAPTLAASTIIYTFTANGFAWTDDWNDGEPIWQYGITRNGNAVINALAAYKVTTDLLEAGCVTAEKISQSYKSSVSTAISDGDAAVTQAFTAADGILSSEITAEVTRATGAESALSSRVTQTESDISAEVIRAGNAESALSSRITQTVDDITAEVTRATGAESALSARITTNANAITAKVSQTGGTASSFAWSLTASAFSLTSNNDVVMLVNSAGATFKGTINADAGNIGNLNLLSFEVGNLYDESLNLLSKSAVVKELSTESKDFFVRNYTDALDYTNKYTITKTNDLVGDYTISDDYQRYFDFKTCYTLHRSDRPTTTLSLSNFSSVYDSTKKLYRNSVVIHNTIRTYNTLFARVHLYQNSLNPNERDSMTIPVGNSNGLQEYSDTTYVFYSDKRYNSILFENEDNEITFVNYDNKYIGVMGCLVPYTSNTDGLLSASLGVYGWWWDALYVDNIYDSGGNQISSSDRDKKTDIAYFGETELTDKLSALFDLLKPATYKMKDGTSGRTHIGLIAQDVASSLNDLEIDSKDFAAFCRWNYTDRETGDDKTTYGIRYSEFIALCVDQIQKLKNRVSELEKEKANG